jgi:hypothetical protein
MTKLHQLHDRYGQSPWLDNLTRGDLVGGRLRRLDAQATLERLAAVGIDLRQTADVLEAEGVAAFANSHDELLALLQARANSSWQVQEATRQPGARSGTGRDAPASLRTRS